jgi:hypothetical protein
LNIEFIWFVCIGENRLMFTQDIKEDGGVGGLG